MEAAWIKLLTVLLGLPSFGVEPDPAPPSAAEVTRYAPAQSDFTVYADLQAFVPNNYQALTSLPSLPQISADKQASAAAGGLVSQIEMGRAMIKATQGLDPVTDVKWVAAWITLPDAGDPSVIAVVRGNFPADLLDKIGAGTGAKPRKVGGGQMVALPDGQSCGVAADHALLCGTTALVQARLATGWKPAKVPAQLTRMLDGKPFLVLASSPSAKAIRRISREFSGDEAALARDLVGGHTFAAMAFAHDGLSWTWTDRSAKGYARALLASEGMLELMRAGHLGTRGLVRLVLAGLGSYVSQSPEVAAIDRHQADILRVVESFTGDGTFQAKVDRDAAGRTVSVRAWDKELARVVPGVGAAVIAGALFAVASGGTVKMESKAAAPAAKPAAAPRKPAPATQPSKPKAR
jgi:hypothetical protein